MMANEGGGLRDVRLVKRYKEVMSADGLYTELIPEDEEVSSRDEKYTYVIPRDEIHADVRRRNETYVDVQPGNETYTDVQPGNETYTDVQPGNETYTDVQSGNETYTDVQSGNETYTDVQPGNENYSDVQAGNDTHTDVKPRYETYTDANLLEGMYAKVIPRNLRTGTVSNLSVIPGKSETPKTSKKFGWGTPESEMSGSRMPEIRSPSVWVPGVRSPSVWVPGVRSPSVRLHGVRSPSVGVHGVRSPSVGVHGVRSPNVGVHGVQSPNVGVHGVQSPNVGVHEVQSPNVGVHGVQSPSVGVHGVRSPSVGVPEIRSHSVGVPIIWPSGIGVPLIRSPDDGTPGVRSPDGGAPGIRSPDGGAPGIRSPEGGVPSIRSPNGGVPGDRSPYAGGFGIQLSGEKRPEKQKIHLKCGLKCVAITGNSLLRTAACHYYFSRKAALFVRCYNNFKAIFPTLYSSNEKYLYDIEVKEDDILIAGYPRSGTQLIADIVWNILNNIDGKNMSELYGKPLYVRTPLFEFDGFFDVKYSPLNYYYGVTKTSQNRGLLINAIFNENTKRRILITHLPLSMINRRIIDLCKVIYIARDPKNVFASLFFANQLFRYSYFKGTIEQFWYFYQDGHVLYGNQIHHVIDWWPIRHQKNVMFLYYDAIIDPKMKYETVKTIGNLLGISLTPIQRKKICSETHIIKMEERLKGFYQLPSDQDHFNHKISKVSYNYVDTHPSLPDHIAKSLVDYYKTRWRDVYQLYDFMNIRE